MNRDDIGGCGPLGGAPCAARGTDAAGAARDVTLVFRIAYEGARYCGFAEQPGLETVAGELRRAFETLLRRQVGIVCAGRTDAGVHAVGQHVSVSLCESELAITRDRWMRAMDGLLPDDIAIREIYRARSDFSARFDARSRLYTYRIAEGPARPVLSAAHVWWHRLPLDEDAMAAAASCLVGEHDFKSFCKLSSAVDRPTRRRVLSVDLARRRVLGEDVLAFTIRGTSFLHSMVRVIVGSLAEVGAGRREPAWLAEALAARDRRAAGPTAPAKGLCFMDVAYDVGELVRID